MKHLIRKAGMVLAVLLLVSASVFPGFAIGFDAEVIYDSVVVVTAGNSLGSGFAIGEDCIITNAHVVENARSIYVSTYSGKEYRAVLYAMDSDLDLAVLTVADASFIPLACADPEQIKIGDDIYTIGAPNSLSYTLTKGVISSKSRTVRGQSYIQIDAPINEGNSGGPLLNDYGQVLGVNTLKLSEGEGLGFSIPITTVRAYLERVGASLDESGNVIGRMSGTVPPESLPEPEPQKTPLPNPAAPTEQTPYGTTPAPALQPQKVAGAGWLVPVLITVGALLLVFFAVVLIVQKKRSHIAHPYDPRESTDFEIEIEDMNDG